MVEIVKLATPFPATALVDLILKNELFDLNASRTFSLLGDKIFLDSYSSNLKLFDFKVSLEDSNEMTIRLRILHGSVFTVSITSICYKRLSNQSPHHYHQHHYHLIINIFVSLFSIFGTLFLA